MGLIIAIDGPAASGKGTLARRIAARFGLAYLDTGALYRAVARDVKAAGLPLDDAEAAAGKARRLDPASLDDPGLKAPGMGEAASVVASLAAVRAALLDYQRAFARQEPGAVLDGRDIGTVVCPFADVKIFVEADTRVRAERRHAELTAKGEQIAFETVLATIEGRDRRDRARASAPLARANDALLLDTTRLSIDAAFDAAVELIKRKIGQ